MNRIYSLVFNRALRQVQVVSEHACRRRDSIPGPVVTRGAVPMIAGLAVALALAVVPFSALAQGLPELGPRQPIGIDNIENPTPDSMIIDQGAHLRALIDWATFDIDAGNTVTFQQLAEAVALNVISDENPSQIFGNLTATGTVFLVNPNGIVFGESASVNVGGLIASTLAVDGDAFLVGGDVIAMTPSGDPAEIVNEGAIVATGTQGVTLLGGHLSNAGTGIITAELGSINLLGTQTATLSFGAGNRLSIAVGEALTGVPVGVSAVVQNNGELHANNGRVYLDANVASGILSSAVNHSGIINASGVDADGNGGTVLSGGGSGVEQSGSTVTDGTALITAEGSVSLDGGSLDVTGLTVDAGSLHLASDLEVAGNLSLTVVDGGISQSGAWKVGGTSALVATSGRISLDNPGNDFLGRVSLTGGEVSIQDRNALTLGELDVGALEVTSQGALDLGSGAIDGNLVANSDGGNITQSPGGLQVGGTSDLVAGTGGISLGRAGNRFDGAVQLTGSAAVIASDFDLGFGTLAVGSLGASSEGSVAFGGGSVGGDLVVTSGGDITQTGAIAVGGVSTLVAESGSIALAHPGNDFGGTVNLDSAGAAEIGSAGTLTLGALDVDMLVATSHGTLDLGSGSIGGDLVATSNNGAIIQSGALEITGTSTLDAGTGSITLARENNWFGSAVTATGNGITLVGRDDLAIAGLTFQQGPGHAVHLEAGGTLRLPGAIDTGPADLILASNGGQLATAGMLAGASVKLTGADGIILGHDLSGESVALHSGANISQLDGVLDAGRLGVQTEGSAWLVAENQVDELGNVNVEGHFSLRNVPAITQLSGTRVSVGGHASFSSEADITLKDPAGHVLNRVGGEVSLTGGNVEISVDNDGLRLGQLDVASLVAHSEGTLNLGYGEIRGDLQATGNEDIRQSGALAVHGTTALNASGVIFLEDDGNRFDGTVHLTGETTRIAASGALQLGDLDVDALRATSVDNLDLGQGEIRGSLEATSGDGDISQSGALVVEGYSNFSAASGDISLEDPQNDFSGAVSLTGGDVRIRDRNALVLGDLRTGSLLATSAGELDLGRGRVDGDLVAESDGNISQSGALQVTGTSTLRAMDGDINLDEANDFGGAVGLTGGMVAIRDSGALTLGRLSVGSLSAASGGALELGEGGIAGNLFATSDADGITQGGRLHVSGDIDLQAGSGDITLQSHGNSFSGTTTLSGGDVSVSTIDTVTLGRVNAASLDVAAVGGLIRLRGDITSTGNQAYRGPVQLAQAVALDSDAGDISFSSRLDGPHALEAAAPAGAVRFDDFVGRGEALAGLAVDARSLQFRSGLNVAGDLELTVAEGGITQGNDGWTIGGAAALDAGASEIRLVRESQNTFGGPVSLAGGAATLAVAGGLQLGTLDVASLDVTSNGPLDLGQGRIGGDLRAIANGADMGQSGALEVGGSSHLAAVGQTITVDNPGNRFAGPVGLVGEEIAIRASGPLALGRLFLGSLWVRSGGALDLGDGLVSGSLEAISDEGGIGQGGALAVSGEVHLDAGSDAITLGESNNVFRSQVNLVGGATSIRARDTLTLGSVTASSLDVTAWGIQLDEDIVTPGNQAYNGALSLSAERALRSTAGDILFGSRVNGAGLEVAAAGTVTFAGPVGAVRPLSGLHVEAGRFRALSTLEVGGDLSLTVAAGGIGQAAGWTVGGTTALDAGAGDITLTDAANEFGGGVGLAGGAATIIHAGALRLDALDVASLDATSGGNLDLGRGTVGGSLTARSHGGDIVQSGALAVGGTAALEADAGDITLDDAGNDFAGLVHLAGGTVRIADANSLALGALDVAGLEATSHGGLGLGGGRIAGDLAARSHGGDIGQSGGLEVTGETLLAAGTGAIALEHGDNDFAGDVALAGNGVALSDANDLKIASLANGGAAVSLVAGGTLTLPAGAIDSGTESLRLASFGGTLVTSGALAGGDVSLEARDGISIGDDVTALGTLALASGSGVSRSGGVLTAQTLTGRVGGAAALGTDNAIAVLGAFSAAELELGTSMALAVTGPVEAGSRLALRTGGDLEFRDLVSAGEVRLDSVGGIRVAGEGRIVADTLSGSAGGPTQLGDRDRFVDNRVARLGGFTSAAGFSMTNAGTLTLASVGGSAYSIDAGSSETYLSVVDGDLLQEGTTPIRNGMGFYASTGHIGLSHAPIHVIGVKRQMVEFIGLPPAYFHATRADGTLLQVVGASAVNVPVSAIASRVQRSSQGEVEYVDLGADASGYRAYGIVQPGIRLPDDQQPECDPDFPGPECIEA